MALQRELYACAEVRKFTLTKDEFALLNDPKVNSAIDAKLRNLRERAAQQPNSYIVLFREAADLAEDQFKRAMAAEARLFALGNKD